MRSLKVILFVLVVAGCGNLFSKDAGAANGDLTAEYPNTSGDFDGSAQATYAIAELCSSDTTRCMKGAVTYARVLAPATSLGQQVSLRIVDGCDGTNLDKLSSNFGYVAHTKFEVLTTGSSVRTPDDTSNGNNGCQAGVGNSDNGVDLILNFTVPTNSVVTNGKIVLRIKVTAYGVSGGSNSEAGSFYQNWYRIRAQTPGTFVDKETDKGICPLSSYPRSCPSNGSSYSSVGQPGTGRYSQKANVALACNSAPEALSFEIYDLDAGNYGQTDIRGRLTERNRDGSPGVRYIPNVDGWRFNDLIPTGNYVGNDQRLNILELTDTGLLTGIGYPAGSREMLRSDKIYSFEVWNLDRRNVFQIIIFNGNQYDPGQVCNPPKPFTCRNFRIVGGDRTVRLNERFTLEVTVDVTDPTKQAALDNLVNAAPSGGQRRLQAGIAHPPTAAGDPISWDMDQASFPPIPGVSYGLPPDRTMLWGNTKDIYAVSGADSSGGHEFPGSPGDNYYYQRLGVASRTFSFSVQAPGALGTYPIGLRFLDRFQDLGLGTNWLGMDKDYCLKNISVTNPPPPVLSATIDVFSNCTVIFGTATDGDSPDGILELHLRFDSSYASNPRPQDATIYSDAGGDWRWVVPQSYKTFSARSIWVDVLGEDSAGVGNEWRAATNSGAVSIGPCRSLPSGTITVTCNASGSQITVGVNASDNQSPQVNVALSVNRSGGVSNLTGTGSGAITLDPTSTFIPNYGGPPSSRTVSGTVTDLDGDVFTMVPVVYSCNAVPECEINPISVTINDQFYISVTLRNNTPIATPVAGPANFTTYNSSGVLVPGGAGTGSPYDTTTSTYGAFPVNIPVGGSVVVRSNTPVIVSAAGRYDVRWDVAVAGGGISAVGECGSILGGQGAIDASLKPYVRFYGNDVVAGGGYGNCTSTPNINVRGNGTFGSGARTHANYKGSAVELAVFATGGINGVLPGGQDTGRTSLTELSFANTTPPAGEFGGGFNEVLCADDYWADRPSTNNPLPVVNAGHAPNPSAVMVDLSNPALAGVYTYNGDLYVYASAPLAPGKRVTIYNEGRTVIGRVIGALPIDRLAYDTSVPWTSVGQIPLIKVVTKGNLFIDDNFVQVDGLYVAVPNEADPTNTGEIHTCSAFGLGLDLTRPGPSVSVPQETFIVQSCVRQLVVNGAFVAKRVHLLRSNGNIGAGTPAEPYTSATIAEVFRFSPEMYLALLSNGGGSGRFDSILSLPPAL